MALAINLVLIATLFSLTFVNGGGNEQRPETLLHDTKQGRIEGVVGESLPNRLPFASFHAIPFAKPPTGQLRFRNPEPAEATWGSQVRDGTKPPSVCPQWVWKNTESLQVRK